MHNLVIAQTNFPSPSSREYQPHCSLTASTSISPRPCSASSPASVRTGGRGLASLPPAGPTGGADEYGLIRRWMTAVACAVEDPERVRRWGGHAIAVRLVLLALGQAAMVSGSSVVEFGCRNLALHAALSHRTVARVLELLRNEPDPLIDLVSRRQLARADRYALRIPGRYAGSVCWRRRRAGRIDAVHPVFLALGGRQSSLSRHGIHQARWPS